MHIRIVNFLGLALLVTAASFGNMTLAEPPARNTFTNPIVFHGADPWVVFWNDAYYYCYVKGRMILVNKASRLQDIEKGARAVVWRAPRGEAYSENLWAPELHDLDGAWYIYVAADDGDNHTHRMYVLEGQSPDPQGRYEMKGQMTDPTDKWAIDGTVLVMDSGAMYFIWSGWAGDVNVQQNLYIAPMSNPWTISGERVLISQPEHAWETIGTPLINEGPQVLQHNGRVFIGNSMGYVTP